MASELKVMPKPAPRSDKDEVIERLRGEQADDIVVIYRTKGGPFDVLTNQGDAARVLFFIEQFKHAMMEKYAALQEEKSSS